ncbi:MULTISPECIES: XRE family transcriptional regulator [Streptomyces]|uniref:XRE family transcriptional regulator n=1 Tax=Streptomyces TaxID=1883 RepID=UPI001C588688|nr:XRE family transcriptional regulator [Streptomyces sp. 09ZI22]MBW3361523.1 ImmA/IrrE family metallo-endopeptidase [Streptomyces sp. 09ZI22]
MSTTHHRQREAEFASRAFDPQSLTTARQLRGLRKNELAKQVGLTPAAVSQYELAQSRPSASAVAQLAMALGVPAAFFASGHPHPAMPSAAHFRSLRATTQLQRDQALAFGKIAWQLVTTVEKYVELPTVVLPRLPMPPDPARSDVASAAQEARSALGVQSGPVPHVTRLLEAHGVVVMELPPASERVDAFSHWYGSRPLIFRNPLKNDLSRSRFDVAHEVGHLIMHLDAEPGSRIVENQAHDFAAEFLMPRAEIAEELPRRLDWETLYSLKRRWGTSLKALVYRAHSIGVFRDTTYKRAMMTLSQHGDPEPCDLGPRESPALLESAVRLCEETGVAFTEIVARSGLPAELADQVYATATMTRPRINLGPASDTEEPSSSAGKTTGFLQLVEG